MKRVNCQRIAFFFSRTVFKGQSWFFSRTVFKGECSFRSEQSTQCDHFLKKVVFKQLFHQSGSSGALIKRFHFLSILEDKTQTNKMIDD